MPCRLAVHSNPRLLEQMIRNLLSNAVKYTRQGGILLGCRRRGTRLRIEVWDTGLGIPKSQQRAIFDEFHQLNNPARELNRGLGLGLAIVQRLGDLLAHPVDLRSCEGRGSVFAIEVPVAAGGNRLAVTAKEPMPVATAARGGLILIVEDDPAVRESLELLLRLEGYRTAATADGEEAIQLVTQARVRPDLVIVDYNLPRGQTGLQVMARLHERLDPNLPALVLTGDISTETLREIGRAGYVKSSKPIAAEDLTRVLQSLLPDDPPHAGDGTPRTA